MNVFTKKVTNIICKTIHTKIQLQHIKSDDTADNTLAVVYLSSSFNLNLHNLKTLLLNTLSWFYNLKYAKLSKTSVKISTYIWHIIILKTFWSLNKPMKNFLQRVPHNVQGALLLWQFIFLLLSLDVNSGVKSDG